MQCLEPAYDDELDDEDYKPDLSDDISQLDAELAETLGQLAFELEPVLPLDQIRPAVLERLAEKPDSGNAVS